jgi:hypothetical protein
MKTLRRERFKNRRQSIYVTYEEEKDKYHLRGSASTARRSRVLDDALSLSVCAIS